MSKKNTAEAEPSNALIMRVLTSLNTKVDRLPTVDHLSKLEADLHVKLETNNQAIRDELRAEFKSEMKAQAEKLTDMIAQNAAQASSGAATKHPGGRNDTQQGRYLRARRSFKIWPVTLNRGQSADREVKEFFINHMKVPTSIANAVELDTIRHADQTKNSKIVKEIVVTFADVESRDSIKSYANGLASSNGQAGLRLDVPPCLKGSFKVLNDHALAMVKIYGKEVKRNIKFDDTNQDLMMDLKLPTSQNWHNITIGQAREAKRIREQLDMQNIRKTALTNNSSSNALEVDKARALMLSISPNKPGPSGAQTGGVVHINNIEDWRSLENRSSSNEDTMDNSIEEILRAGATR